MPEKQRDIYSQMSSLIDTVSGRLAQRSRRQTLGGDPYTDGNFAREAIEWGTVATATHRSIAKVTQTHLEGESPPTYPGFEIGIVSGITQTDIIEKSIQHYTFPEMLRIAMAVHGVFSGGELRTRINTLRRNTVPPTPPISLSAINKWINGTSLPMPEKFHEVINSLEIDSNHSLPLHALTGSLLVEAYEKRRAEKRLKGMTSTGKRRTPAN